jgi:Flp pilus assembly protein TadD
MILAAAIAAAIAAAVPAPVAQISTPAPSLVDTARAIDAGRLDQARMMIAKLVAGGHKGPQLDLLLADYAFASGKSAEALARYEQMIAAGTADAAILERAGLAALGLGLADKSLPLITRAIEAPGATWRAWNARGVIADMQADWSAADDAYEHAARLAPRQAEVLNNRGWSQLLRGEWGAAVLHLERAAKLDPRSTRIANNLELARAALASELPRRRAGESDREWAERLNDAGVLAQRMGDRAKATAAFTQALEASGSWYARAAGNLEAVTEGQ